LHDLAQRFCIDVLSSAVGTPKLTEDPPFGGLWCDQPAIFLLDKSRLAALLSEHGLRFRGQKAWFLPAAH